MRRFLVLLLLVFVAGCYTSTPPNPSRSEPPAYVRTAAHYRSFPDAQALAAYLRADSDAGPLVSAHRGGPVPAYPENALATFEHSLRHGPVLIECDVRMTRDSVLVLLHDDDLDRTTTGSGPVIEHTFAELRPLLLRDPAGVVTPFRIPTLAEALAWADGRAVLTLDVKRGVPAKRVVEAVRRAEASNRAVVIVYTLIDALWYRDLAPELVISASAETLADVRALLDSGLDPDRLIVFTGVGEVNPDVLDELHRYNIRAILGTFGTIDERAQRAGAEVYMPLLERGVDVIATDNVPGAMEAVRAYGPWER